MLNTDNTVSQTDREKPPMLERLQTVSAGISYLQLVQVHADPQLQLSQVQFGLPHFTF